jgi:glycosyltransferase involved in cell wall biosynthesis
MERLSLKGHEIRVVDFEIDWARKIKKQSYSRRLRPKFAGKACENSNVLVIRPGFLKIPLLDYVSITVTHTLEIRRQIREFKPDLFVGFGILNAFIGMHLAKRRKIPFVYYLIDSLHMLIPIKPLRYLGKILESNTLRKCDTVCVISEELRRYAIEMGARSEKVHIVRAGVDMTRFNPNIDGAPIRKELGLTKDDLVLFFMGWLYSFSGLKEVAMELTRVKKSMPHAKLLIIGRGDLYHDLQRIKREHDLHQLLIVDWKPYEEIPKNIAASDVCLLPAHNNRVMRNIVPIKMYEYMACGKPVIATKLPGIMKEFGYSNGVIYVDRPEDVLKKVEALGDRDSINRLGLKASRHVERYSWETITEKFERILELANSDSRGFEGN